MLATVDKLHGLVKDWLLFRVGAEEVLPQLAVHRIFTTALVPKLDALVKDVLQGVARPIPVRGRMAFWVAAGAGHGDDLGGKMASRGD